MKSNKTFKFIFYVTTVHCLTYFICGVIFSNLMRYSWWWQQPVISDYFRVFGGAANALGPFIQIGRGLLFALVLLPLRDFLKSQKLSWLWLWLIFVGIGILGTPAAAPSSIEGMIYSKLPFIFHFVGWPEIMSQTFLFCFLVCRYLRKSDDKDKKSILKNPLILALAVAFAEFFIYTIVSIVFAVIQNVAIDSGKTDLKNMGQFLAPTLLIFVLALIRKPRPIVKALSLYLLSALSFTLYQKFILNDMNPIYDFIAPIFPSLIFFLYELKMKKASAGNMEKKDLTESENTVE